MITKSFSTINSDKVFLKTLWALVILAFTITGCVEVEPIPSQPEKSKLRAIQTIGTNWTYQEEYRYHSDGRVDEIRWERNTPFTTQGVEIYQYDNRLQLSGIIKEMTGLVTEEIRYRYSGSQLAEASSFSNGVKESYTLYSYNPAGQLVKTQFFKRDPSSNEMLADGETRFSYHPHGNVQEIQEFVFDRQQSQMKLHTTRTFDEYLLNREAVLDA
jgi:antitoxin component YwqK of YwqJK toxin-antitoxin module